MKFYKDNESVSMKDATDFCAFLRELEENTSWLTPSDSDSWKFFTDPFTVMNPSDFTEADNDGVQNHKIFISLNGKPFCIRDCAWQSVVRRCGIDGRSIARLIDSDPDSAAFVLNACSKVSRTNAQPCIVNGKLNCMVSTSDGNGYEIIPASQVYDETLKGIVGLAQALPEEFSGYWTYSGIVCRWIIPLMYDIGNRQFKTQIILATSDNGLGAIKIRADLVDGGFIPLIDPIVIEHRSDRNELTFEEAFRMLGSALNEGKERMENLNNIPINNPVSCLKAVMKKCKLPAGYTEKVVDDYEATKPENQTALDVYVTMSKLLDLLKSNVENCFYHEKMEANIRKAIGINWEKYDS